MTLSTTIIPKIQSPSTIWTGRSRPLRRLRLRRVATAVLGFAIAGPLLAGGPTGAVTCSAQVVYPWPPAGPSAGERLSRLPVSITHFDDPIGLYRGTGDAGIRLRLMPEAILHNGSRDAEGARRFDPGGLSEQLLGQMRREALRHEGSYRVGAAGADDPGDSVAESLRSQEAQRIITRAFNRTLEDEMTLLVAQGSGRLRTAFDWLQDIGSSRRRSRGILEAGTEAPLDATLRRDGTIRTSLGLSVGAHPRLILSAHRSQISGRIELPLLGEPLRLSLERPLGARGRAVLLSGLGGRQDWAVIGLSLSF